MNYNQKSKFTMWYKVQELTEQGLNKSQIKRETSLDRATIRKYQQMDEATFHKWIGRRNSLPKKLTEYRVFIKDILSKTPYLSAAQVEDRLKEHYKELPDIHSKTVYNFVLAVRSEFHIPKPSKASTRVFEKLPDPPYGEEAQVDFGETWMQNKYAKRVKIYFFAISLSRSRYKFIYLTDKPFTSSEAVKAHHSAFDYFGGVPKKILYDQDSVFMHNENLGDYLLTLEFAAFCRSQDFKAVFCRKADPQSKGKIESVVKYVKQNFLRGREYVNIGLLNGQAIEWLERTANAKKHAATQLIPKLEWEQEKQHLMPVKQKQPSSELKSYKVRKDNTVLYRGNFYTLPLGTYTNRQSAVLLKADSKEMTVYACTKEFICTHSLSFEKGKTVRNTDHTRPKSQTLEVLHQQVFELMGSGSIAETYLQMLQKDKSRYYRDNLQYFLRNHNHYPTAIIDECLRFCIENKVFNAKNVIDILNQRQPVDSSIDKRIINSLTTANGAITGDYGIIETSDINKYENIFN